MRPGSIRGLLASLVAAAVLSGCSAASETDVVPPPGDPAIVVDTPEMVRLKAQSGIADCRPGSTTGALPALTLPCLGGGPSVDLSTVRGPLVINLWGSYCGPCRTEMPVLGEFFTQHGGQVGVLGVDMLDTFPEKALEQARKRGATYPQLADTAGVLLEQPAFARGRRLPLLVFVDAAGEVQGQHLGGVTSVEELAGLVSTYLDVDLA